MKQHLPDIICLHGHELIQLDDSWSQTLSRMTRHEMHLLYKTADELQEAARDDRIIVAFDTHAQDMVIGCIALWELGYDNEQRMWHELGTFMVTPTYRYRAKSNHACGVGDVLYHQLLATNTHRNILATTTNMSAIKTGRRHGMHMIRFEDLPNTIHRATCVCPEEKTRVQNNAHCPLKNQICRVRISYHTWMRIGQPELLAMAI